MFLEVLVGHLPHMGQFAAALLQSPAAAGRLGGLFHPASWRSKSVDFLGSGALKWWEMRCSFKIKHEEIISTSL